MDADEIRQIRMNAVTEDGRTEFLGSMLQEIAAQLAELNTHLKSVDAAVFCASRIQ